jgi:hypothetical protein
MHRTNKTSAAIVETPTITPILEIPRKATSSEIPVRKPIMARANTGNRANKVTVLGKMSQHAA